MGLNVRTGHCKFSIQLCSGVEWGMLHLLSCIVFCTFKSVKTNTIHTGIPHFPKRFPVPTSFFDFLIIISKRVFIVFDYTIAGVFLKESKTHWNSKIRAYWCTGLWLRLISICGGWGRTLAIVHSLSPVLDAGTVLLSVWLTWWTHQRPDISDFAYRQSRFPD